MQFDKNSAGAKLSRCFCLCRKTDKHPAFQDTAHPGNTIAAPGALPSVSTGFSAFLGMTFSR